MIWIAWRTQRLLFFVSLGVVLLVAVWLIVTGALQEAAWTAFHGPCALPDSSSTCLSLVERYYNASHFSTVDVGIVTVIPGVLGLVLGAPVVAREIEQRTNRLAWTQSISRTRWLLLKLAVGALGAAVIVGLLCPLLWWWTSAVQRGDRIEPSGFDISGFVPVAYVLFAFMLGAALGAVVRRTGWAFALGLPLFALTRLLIEDDVRSGLVAPVAKVEGASAFTSEPVIGWTLNQGAIPVGRLSPGPGQTWQSSDGIVQTCLYPKGQPSGFSKPVHSLADCLSTLRLHYVLLYQPSRHFWSLQAAESAVFLGLALVLLAGTVLAVRRWRT